MKIAFSLALALRVIATNDNLLVPKIALFLSEQAPTRLMHFG
jgi:hypothetical protein